MHVCDGRDGRLQQNDQILAINGHVLDSSRSPQEAIRLLQRASGNVDLVVAREPQPAVVAADTLPLASRQPAPAEPAPAPPLDMVVSTLICFHIIPSLKNQFCLLSTIISGYGQLFWRNMSDESQQGHNCTNRLMLSRWKCYSAQRLPIM